MDDMKSTIESRIINSLNETKQEEYDKTFLERIKMCPIENPLLSVKITDTKGDYEERKGI